MQILGSVKVALTAMVVGLLVPAASAEVFKLDCGPADSPLAAKATARPTSTAVPRGNWWP
jgi:hypothetical protein